MNVLVTHIPLEGEREIENVYRVESGSMALSLEEEKDWDVARGR